MCGEAKPASALRPVFTVRKAESGSQGIWDLMNQQQQWSPSKLGDCCGDCLARIADSLHQAPIEVDGSVVDRILKDMDL